jgi:hypothetical protein
MNLVNPDYFIHVANVLLLVAYSVRDILWLRLFAVGASVISIPYFVLQPATLWAPLAWTVLFAGINLIQSWRLFIERRPVQLSPEEEEVRRLVFSDLPPRKVLHVLNIGSWATAAAGERLIVRGTLPDAVLLIVRGTVQVTRNGEVLGELHPGEFVGSALILSGVAPDVDAVTTQPVRAMRWEVATLEKYLAANPETRSVMQRHLVRDLAAKLDRLSRTGTIAD